jgi:phosphopantothenoylcysteine decarboxylase/phosphopantothenate--cysteine ligase
MHTAVMDRFSAVDVVIMAAAVADYTPDQPRGQKMSKSGAGLTLVLKPTTDILAELGARRARDGKGPVLVGFAAETEDVVARATRKLRDKRVDLIVANDVSQSDRGFEVDANAVVLVNGRPRPFHCSRKSQVAAALLDRVERLRSAAGSVVHEP